MPKFKHMAIFWCKKFFSTT